MPEGRRTTCCDDGPAGHTEQEHHDASACFDQGCRFAHPHGGPFPHPCDVGREAKPYHPSLDWYPPPGFFPKEAPDV